MIAKAKVAAIRHWSSQPCGAEVGRQTEEGSAEFFHLTDKGRYRIYAPWLLPTADFARFAGMDALEVGCGMGADLRQLASAGARATGVDLVPRHLAITQRRFALAGLRVNLIRADAESLPFSNNSFDVVYSFGVLHHTSDIDGALSEIHRVLRPGGHLVLGVYHRFAYNLLAFLAREAARGHLWREPFEVTLGRMEGEGPTTLIRLSTTSELRQRLSRFSDVKISTHHLERWPLRVMRGWAERHFGWYLWAECTR
jgi:SAM-dependent methyltransferase